MTDSARIFHAIRQGARTVHDIERAIGIPRLDRQLIAGQVSALVRRGLVCKAGAECRRVLVSTNNGPQWLRRRLTIYTTPKGNP